MRIDVITLFPEMIAGALSFGITGRAMQRGLLEVVSWNPRDYTTDRHRTVDDRPFGGGPGMVMKVEPLQKAVFAAQEAAPQGPVIHLSPQGQCLTQQAVAQLSKNPRLILIAGRYEGIDERFVSTMVDEEWSIGDYVLSGGELPALVLIDAMARLLPGALHSEASAIEDSFVDGLLDCPHYTRPEVFEGQSVPPVLLSGDHAAIARWRRQTALGRTWLRRPDLLTERALNAKDQALLDRFIDEYGVDSDESRRNL